MDEKYDVSELARVVPVEPNTWLVDGRDNPGELRLCHPTAVRCRLRRIEQRTGGSPWRPRDIAELCRHSRCITGLSRGAESL